MFEYAGSLVGRFGYELYLSAKLSALLAAAREYWWVIAGLIVFLAVFIKKR
jgi:hypothetical protein